MSTRSRIIGFGSAALLVVAGIVGALAVSGTFGQVLAYVLISLGAVLATALVFYEVGLSEDRERARAGEQQPSGAREPSTESRSTPRHDLRPRSPLGRMRGSRRRLK